MGESIASVLVVDDDLAMCRILQRMLSDDRYSVQTSQSVADALGAIEEKHFDAYVMDYTLPDGSGLDIAERIRSKGSEAPIVLISGYDASTVALKAEKFHIFDYLEKPFSRDIISSTVRRAIGSLKESVGIITPDSPAPPAVSKRPRLLPGLRT
jgi:DNA-binding NtrC family response regulator